MPRIILINHPANEPAYKNAVVGSVAAVLWNKGEHRRKFIKRHGRYLDGDALKEGDIYFWGEYEPPTICKIVSTSAPQAIHEYLCPVRNTVVPPKIQNSDPYVFGEHFKNICCKRGRRKYYPGDVLLFGKIENGDSPKPYMKLDTVMVVKEEVDVDYQLNMTQYFKASIEPIIKAPKKRDTFYRGKNYATDNQHFSFVPCVLDNPHNLQNVTLPMPVLDLKKLGFDVKKQLRSYGAKDIPFSEDKWNQIIDAVKGQGWLIGTHVDKI